MTSIIALLILFAASVSFARDLSLYFAPLDHIGYNSDIPIESNKPSPLNDTIENASVQGLPPTKISKRATKTFNECVTTGACMLDMLEVSIAPPSIYTSLAMLTGYGWKRDQIEDAWGPPSLEVLLDAEGWDHADFDDYDYFYAQTWIPSTFFQAGYWAANFQVWINTVKGVIVATRSYGPITPFWPPNSPAPTPKPVTNWSDFAFLMWQQACNDDWTCMRGLNWVIRSDVRNPTTNSIANSAFDDHEIIEEWPGTTFKMDTEVGKALLGSPNGYGVAWLLANHIVAMGSKTVDQVTVFTNDDGKMSLAFHVVDDVSLPNFGDAKAKNGT